MNKYYAENIDIRTMLFRYTVLSNLFGLKFDNCDSEQKLAKNEISDILKGMYSEQKERLLFLYASGVINHDTLMSLIQYNNADFLSDIVDMEKYLLNDEGKDINARIPYKIYNSAISLCAASKKHSTLEPINFIEAIEALRLDYQHIAVINGLIACDDMLMDYMRDVGLEFVKYDVGADRVELYDNINNDSYYADFKSRNTFDLNVLADIIQNSPVGNSENGYPEETVNTAMDYPYIADSRTFLSYLKVYDKAYGKEFLTQLNGAYTEDIQKAYQTFLNEMKLKFKISGYARRRKICGDKINHFDYDYNTIKDNELVSHELKKEDNLNDTINLPETYISMDKSGLMRKALYEYAKKRVLPDKFVAEMYYSEEIYYFVYDRDKDIFNELDTEAFTRDLFNFNKVWSVVRKAAAERKIVSDGTNVRFIYLNEIPEEEQEYAKALAKEQFEKQQEMRKSSASMSTLKQLISNAQNAKAAEETKKQQQNSDSENNSAAYKSKLGNRIINKK